MNNVVQLRTKIGNTRQLVEEFEERASIAGLLVECPADGMFNAQIAIVAEAPGEKEVNGRSPLIWASGSHLWTVLRSNGITRTDCYVTNLSKRQVAFTDDRGKETLSRAEFQQWQELLVWELRQLPNLRYILCLGNYAMRALTGHDAITKWRGSVLPVECVGEGVKGLMAFNPAAVLRDPKQELIFRLDMGRFKRLREGRWREPKILVHTDPSESEILEYLGHIGDSSDPISFDIETISGETACVGFANSATESMCVNFRTYKENRFDSPTELRIRRAIQQLLLKPGVRLVAQNGMFDSSWLWYKDRIRVQPIWYDTMLGHHTLYPVMPHNLGYQTTQYTMHPYYKDDKENWKEGGDINSFWVYNGTDCCITWQIHRAQRRELIDQKLEEFFFSHVMRLQSHLVRMTVGGIKIDQTLRNSINQTLGEELQQHLSAFHAACQTATGIEGYTPNPNSPAQISELLFTKLKLVGRGAKTDAENRERMLKHPRTSEASRAVLNSLGKYKEEHKFFSTYVETDIDEDGRMRCEYKQTGVQKAPGRLSSAAAPWGHYDPNAKAWVSHGSNLQNQPKRAYEMFIADAGPELPEDYCFIYFDLSQAEARFVAVDAGIQSWIEQYERDLAARAEGGSYDTHRALAADMFKVEYEEVPSDDEIDGKKTIRYISKRCRHGLNYRMQPDRLSTTTGLSLQESIRSFELYHRSAPELRKWWRRVEDEVRKTRTLYNAFGRRLYVQGRLDDPTTLESIVAFRPQSTIGDKVSRVIYQAESDDRWPKDARIVLNVHDALVGLAPISKAKHCLSILKKYAEEPMLVRGIPLVIPCDPGISVPDELGVHRWSTIKKVKDIEAAA